MQKSGIELNSFFYNVSFTAIRQLTTGLLQLLTVIIVARSLGPQGNGYYSLSILLPTILSTFLNLGIGPANVYYLGTRKITAQIAVRVIKQWAFVITLAGLSLGSLTILLLGDKLFPGIPPKLLWITLSLFPFTLFHSFQLSIFQGLQRFKLYNALLLIPQISTLLLVVLIYTTSKLTIEAVLFSQFFSVFLAVCLGLLKTETGKEDKDITIKQLEYRSRIIRYGYKAHLSNILAFINYRADIFLVNFLLNPASAGIYIISVQLAEKLWLLSQSVSTVLLPKLSELSTHENKQNLLTPIICRTVAALTAIIAITVAIFAHPLINLMFGTEYQEAAKTLIVLLPGIVAGSGARVIANDIAARGRPELNMYFSLVTVTVNIIGNVVLIPPLGMSGAAIATSIAYIINLGIRLLVYKRISGNCISTTLLITRNDLETILQFVNNKVYRHKKM
jgi:O-antigen/teichoic acid export membrane protein